MADSLTEELFGSEGQEEVDYKIFADEEPPEHIFQEDKDGKGRPDKYATRASGEGLLSTLVMGLGSVLVSRKIDPPVGRCFQFEAPLAGKMIDQTIAGTFIDRLLQPLFRKSDDIEGLGAIFGLPILIGIYERKPELGPLLEGPIREVVASSMDQVAPLMRKETAKRRRTARSLTDISDAFNLPRGADPVDAMMGFIFQDMIPPEGEETEDVPG
jgi:hypothetical protein